MSLTLGSMIAGELGLDQKQVDAVLTLVAGGATVPFIARYRKEATGNLDEVQIRTVQERHAYLVELEERRGAILASIEEQKKLTPELRAKIQAASTKAALEDLYLPFKPKRRTRGTIAIDKGLQPLAQRILEQGVPADRLGEARAYIKGEVKDENDALQGARDIVAEVVADTAEVRAVVRTAMLETGSIVSERVPEKTTGPTKFEQYYAFSEKVATIPSHRFLAIRRGEREGVLKVRIDVGEASLASRIEALMKLRGDSPFAADLRQAVADALVRLLAPSVETDVRVELKMRSDRDAVEIFASNLKSLLLAAPLGEQTVVGVDPGLRTGCKCAAVDMTGKFLDHVTVYPTQRAAVAAQELVSFIKKHAPRAIAVGNGTAGRETEAFVRKALVEAARAGVAADVKLDEIIVVQVNEAGASVYSASDVARDEFPELDVTVRGAISIARRLQDPLAELVKLDPKAIGVGQYQHDVHQPLLARKLDEVVESCVNHVGVELNTASAPLLSRVAGIGPSLAKKIVAHREERGAFKSRAELLAVSGLGPRAFEQAAGFLRVRGGAHPLDASGVHPERYELVERIARDLGLALPELVGNPGVAKNIDVERYVGDGVGELTLRDIVAELGKPGRDPRATFSPPKFRDDVFTLEDLKPGMSFEGVVTNVTAFGAFVDVGVHQDGLVHISQLADRFVKDPSEVVKAGDKLRVRVLEVDLARKRIALTARSEAPAKAAPPPREAAPKGGERGGAPRQPPQAKFSNNPFAALRKS